MEGYIEDAEGWEENAMIGVRWQRGALPQNASGVNNRRSAGFGVM
ncbi:hypothetical protein OG229_15855 [Streptomyces platensis]|nr:hypothetical protein OG229_15855 [Streptomyces platensis]